MSDEHDQVLARLEKIERENRFLKRGITLVLLVLGSLLVMAQAPSRPQTIEVERLVIRYANGKPAIVLDTTENESAEANFYRPDGSNGVALGARSDRSRISLSSPKKELHMELKTGQLISGQDFKTPVGEFAGLQIDRSPASGGVKPLFYLNSETTGETTQYLYADNGSQLRLTNGPDGAAVKLFDNPQTLRAVLGKTNLEAVRSGSIETRPLSSLVLFDKEGKVLWQTP